MLILFKDRKLQKISNDLRSLKKEYGKVQGELIAQRLNELDAAENLEQIRKLRHIQPHELKGRDKSVISVEVKYPYRLLLKPNHDEIPYLDDGGLDWSRITQIKILGIRDTHEKKKR